MLSIYMTMYTIIEHDINHRVTMHDVIFPQWYINITITISIIIVYYRYNYCYYLLL